MKRLLFSLFILLGSASIATAQLPEPGRTDFVEPKLEGYLSLNALGFDTNSMVAKYAQIYASAPSCSRVGQFYFDSVLGKMRTCTVIGSPGTWETQASGSAVGDVLGAASSVDSEIALFSGTGGKTLKRASTTGLLKATAGVIGAATGTDVSTPLFCSDGGATDSYACSLSPALASYVVGTHIRFFANTANTGAASINFNTLGALTVVKVAGGITTGVVTGDILAGQWVDGVIAAGSNFQIQSTLGIARQPLDADLTTIAGLTATTDNFLQAKSSAWASRTIAQVITDLALPYDVAASYDGAPSASSTIRIVVPRAFNSGASWAGTICSAGTAATAQTDFLIKVNTVTKVTLRFAASGTTCSLVSPTSVSFAAADVVEIIAPASADATLANIAISIKGTLP